MSVSATLSLPPSLPLSLANIPHHRTTFARKVPPEQYSFLALFKKTIYGDLYD